MHLHEEYYHRHGLRYPVIKRPGDKMILLYRTDRGKWPTRWIALRIDKKPEAYHPYYYQIGMYRPVHNGTSMSNGAIAPYGDLKRVEWDEYDQELVDMACSNEAKGLIPVTDLSEAKLAVWEMFLYAADETMSKYSGEVLRDIMRSVDGDSSIEDRMKAQERVVEFMQQGSSIFGRWENLRPYYDPGHYAIWLAELTEKLRDSSYREGFSDLKAVAQ